jgi:threonine aldolase
LAPVGRSLRFPKYFALQLTIETTDNTLGDTVTTPTLSMLHALSSASHGDDGYNDDKTTISLQELLAEVTGKESGLFVGSGTMGNQISLRALQAQSPYSILCDHRSHILTAKAGGVAVLSGAMVSGIVPDNGVFLTVEDIKKHVVLSKNVHSCPTKVISLENTLSGTIMPLDEVRKISAFAREYGIKMHLDGARLWKAVAAGAGSLSEYAEYFDSLTMCFTKGLGAPFGSIIVESKEFVQQARWVRQMIGGGMRQCGVMAAAARVAVREQFGKGSHGEGGKLRATHFKAKAVAQYWTERGGKFVQPVDTNMVWLNLPEANISKSEFVRLAREGGVRLNGGRVVVHYRKCQTSYLKHYILINLSLEISEEGIVRLQKVFDGVFSSGRPLSKDDPNNFTDTYG